MSVSIESAGGEHALCEEWLEDAVLRLDRDGVVYVTLTVEALVRGDRSEAEAVYRHAMRERSKPIDEGLIQQLQASPNEEGRA